MTTFIDIHTITTLGAQNLNRGEEGAPKTTTFGGTERQLLSSQSLKKAMRDYVRENELANVSTRTRLYIEKIAKYVVANTGKNMEEAWDIASDYLVSTGYIGKAPAFEGTVEDADSDSAEKSAQVKLAIAAFTEQAMQGIAVKAFELSEKKEEGTKVAKAALQKELKEVLETGIGLDVALFGTMVANEKAFNVDAAAQIAYAIGTNPFRHDFDFFTAVDDLLEVSGSAMMGNVEFGTSNVYRFGTVSLEGLAKNLGVEPAQAVEYVEAFITAFVRSLPTGKQNSFAARVLPSFVNITIRNTQPLSLVSAFETAVPTAAEAIDALKNRRDVLEQMYDEVPLFSADLEEGGSLRETLDQMRTALLEVASHE